MWLRFGAGSSGKTASYPNHRLNPTNRLCYPVPENYSRFRDVLANPGG